MTEKRPRVTSSSVGDELPLEVGNDAPVVLAGPRKPSAGVVATVSGVIAGLIIVLALFGPWIASHSIGSIVGLPYESPGPHARLGTDFLGRDILSRVLAGGRHLIVISAIATLLTTLIGVAVGLIAGFSRRSIDALLMRAADVLLTLPSILVLLVFATGFGGGAEVLIIVVVMTHAPLQARITRAAVLQIVGRGFVEAAIARGERTFYILLREILPNVRSTAVAYSGLVFVGAVYITASASFLGIGAAPPASDWGRMIQENFQGVEQQPWGVAVPAVLLILLAATVNLFADGLQHRYMPGAAKPRRRS